MVLGTHNSITGMPATNLFGILFSWTSKCQDLTLWEQYANGVRAFDLRIKRKRKGCHCDWVLCHGLAEYNDESIYSILAELNTMSDQCYVRLGLETFIGNPTSAEIIDFQNFYSACCKLYDKIAFAMYIKHEVGNSTTFTNGMKFYELQHSPANFWEALKGPRRLLKYQIDAGIGDFVCFKDFV